MKIESVSPILSVDDLVKSIAFYRHPLGFDLAWSWGEPADIAAVCRDSVEITLTQRAGAKPVGTAHIYLGVSGIDDYYQTGYSKQLIALPVKIHLVPFVYSILMVLNL